MEAVIAQLTRDATGYKVMENYCIAEAHRKLDIGDYEGAVSSTMRAARYLSRWSITMRALENIENTNITLG